MSKINIPCNEAHQVCDKSQYKECTFWDKLKLIIHLFRCKTCKTYSRRNAKLTCIIRDSKVTCLDKKDKELLKEHFEKVIQDGNIKQK